MYLLEIKHERFVGTPYFSERPGPVPASPLNCAMRGICKTVQIALNFLSNWRSDSFSNICGTWGTSGVILLAILTAAWLPFCRYLILQVCYAENLRRPYSCKLNVLCCVTLCVSVCKYLCIINANFPHFNFYCLFTLIIPPTWRRGS